MARQPQKPTGEELTRVKRPLRVHVCIPQDLPITRIEVEVFAALLDDLDIESLAAPEAAE